MKIKYKIIYKKYSDLIDNGSLKPGDYMPSEAKMMEENSSSRDTVRKAMNLLEQNHYILKQRGKESIVLDRNQYDFPVSKIMSFKELASSQKITYKTIVEDLSIIIDEKSIIETLEADKDEEIYRLIRVREIDGEKIIIDKDYLRKKYVGKLTKKICEASIYEYFENVLKLKIGIAKKIIQVKRATSEDKILLDLNNDDYVAVITSFTRLESGELFQYSESRHRVDKFQFTDYAKR